MEALVKAADFVRKHPAVQISAIVLGAILLIPTYYVLFADFRVGLDSFGGFGVFLASSGIVALTIGTFVAAYITAERSWRRVHSNLLEANQVLETERQRLTTTVKGLIEAPALDSIWRFEEIEEREVRLGWVPFFPTLKVDDFGRKLGAGPGIIREVFGGKVEYVSPGSTWENVLSELNAGRFDVVATPIYDIRERRSVVDFTAPLFYSDIGLFAPVGGRVERALNGRRRMTFPEAREALREIAPTLRFCVHKGELQEKMALKHFPEASKNVRYADKSVFAVPAALTAMVEQEGEFASDLYFCERVQGEGHPDHGNNFYNLLHAGQILFPAAFAVRRGADTLRKFINLRLMTIENELGDGIRGLLVKHSEAIIPGELMGRIDEYFIRQRDISRREPAENNSKVLPFTG